MPELGASGGHEVLLGGADHVVPGEVEEAGDGTAKAAGGTGEDGAPEGLAVAGGEEVAQAPRGPRRLAGAEGGVIVMGGQAWAEVLDVGEVTGIEPGAGAGALEGDLPVLASPDEGTAGEVGINGHDA